MKSDFSTKTYIHVLIVAILGLLIYSNTFHADFVFDDEIYIIQNPAIKDLSYFLHPLKVFHLTQFTRDFTYAFITRIAGYLTFALNYHFNGLDVTGYHVFNLLVHIINALLVYFLMRLIFQTPFFSDVTSRNDISPFLNPPVFALFSALIFVSHPVQTQAVTYIIQRWTSLATLFYLLSVLAYVKSRLSCARPVKYALYIVSLISAVTAMLVKEISFTLPVMIALLEFFLFQGVYKKRIIALAPFFSTMLVIPSALFVAEGGYSMEDINNSMNTLASFPDMARMDYLFTQFRVIVTYIRLLILPVNQNLDYDYPVYHSFFSPPVLISFLFLLFLFSLGIYSFFRSKDKGVEGRHELRIISMGILWFFITLSIESSVIPIKDIFFEHRLYLPSVGFIMAVMAAVAMIVRRAESRTVSKAIMTIIVCSVLVLSGAAYARNRVWKTNVSLWEDVVKKSPSKARPHNNLGVAYEKMGRTNDAINQYLMTIRIDPVYVEAHYNLGLAYDKQGRTDDAVRELLTAIQIRPRYAQAHNNLGIIYGREGRTEDAIQEFLIVKQLTPDSVKAYNNLGIMYAREGRTDDAVKEFAAAIQLNPDYADAHYNLGITYRKQGRLKEAVKEFQTALRLNPDHAGARKNLEALARGKK
jgi:Flp pilus assembly protein TadD